MSSRLCVKNIPPYVSDARLREHFSSVGAVTDAKVMRRKDGASRRFGYIGFATEADAAKALDYFHGTYIDTLKIQVQPAVGRGEEPSQRPWSKYSKGSSRYERRAQKVEAARGEGPGDGVAEPEATADAASDAAAAGGGGADTDRAKEEFMAIANGRKDGKFWANDAQLDGRDVSSAEAEREAQRSRGAGSGAEDDSDDDEDYQEMPAAGAGAGADGAESEDGADEDGAPPERKEDGVSAMDFLKGKVGAFSDSDDDSDGDGGDEDEDEDGDEDEDADDGDAPSSAHGAAALAGEGDAAEEDGETDNSRLFVRNLPFSCTEEDISALFGEFGHVDEVHLPLDRQNRGKGFCFVSFLLPENAEEAMTHLDGTAFQGRLIHVLAAKRRPKELLDEETLSKMSYKDRKEYERRRKANDRTGWNASHLRSDAAVAAAAEKLGVSPGDLMRGDAHGSGDMAVAVSIAETEVIRENRAFLLGHGVRLDAPAPSAAQRGKAAGAARSKRALLVKNLPFRSTAEELAPLFEPHGAVEKVVLPPSGTVALVVYAAVADARTAMKRLAYRRFKHVPVYLEWAPLAEAGAEERAQESGGGAGGGADGGGAAAQSAQDAGASAGPDAPDAEQVGESCTLYIKNLDFSVTEADLLNHFAAAGDDAPRVASVPKKTPAGGASRRSGAQLSMGFGFVEFASSSAAQKALRRLQGSRLAGRAIALKASEKRLGGAQRRRAGGAEGRTKLIVRNVPFQATAKDIRRLFGVHGALQRVRLPKRVDQTHRGFCFVEYGSSAQAAEAMEALSGTHLYGRHLVIEWAEQASEGLGAPPAAKRARVSRS